MSLVVNTNVQAANAARSLNGHYGRLALSTQRLSSGLRVNSAADDAAGLAIRELQRADIAALNQGARNANDAISLIQVADGALGIIDEKLLRMKELAEQAATGTYDSTQRLMIESEYQAMASEITRIANATDFNGIHLLDGSLTGIHDGGGLASTGSMKIHFGSGNDSSEDYYYVEIGDCTSAALGLGSGSTWQDVRLRAARAFEDSLVKQIKDNAALTDQEKEDLLGKVDANVDKLLAALDNATDYQQAWQFWDPDPANGFLPEGMQWPGSSSLMADYLDTINASFGPTDVDVLMEEFVQLVEDLAPKLKDGELIGNNAAANGYAYDWTADYINPVLDACEALARKYGMDAAAVRQHIRYNAMGMVGLGTAPDAYKDAEHFYYTIYGRGSSQLGVLDFMRTDASLRAEMQKVCDANIATQPDAAAQARDEFWRSLDDMERQKLLYAWGQAAIYNLANADSALPPADYGIGMADAFDFPDADMLAQALADMQKAVGHMDFAGFTVRTQEDAQQALAAIQNAIESKDKIRASLGATQNRLENTVANLTIQAENLQAAESRISDVDVAAEMTEFVRNQILSQSAVAMLGQANSLPQMAMQIIGG